MKKISGVELIPSSLVACELNGVEARIMELAPEGLVIRVPEKLDSFNTLMIAFFRFDQSRYQEITIHDYEIIEIKEMDYDVRYAIQVNQNDYFDSVNSVIRDYGDYIRYKMTGDDGYVSNQMVSYPDEKEDEFGQDLESYQYEWCHNIAKEVCEILTNTKIELAVQLDNYLSYDSFLSMHVEEWFERYCQKNYFLRTDSRMIQLNRLYIGNEFCHNLFPDSERLYALLNQAKREGVRISIATTYLRENMIERMEECMETVNQWCQENHETIEIVVNDWGMQRILKKHDKWLQPVLGVLLNKRRKDPRYVYKSGFEQQKQQLSETNINIEEYQIFLREVMNITRYEFEACGYPIKLPEGFHSLHLPYYQTNTSQYCGLNAVCQGWERGTQKLPSHCKRYCEEYFFAYPKHLNMLGKYNSLFAFDINILSPKILLKDYLTQGIDRIVLNYL